MALANYPMAIDQGDHRLFVITRFPARMLVLDTNTGKTVERLPAVGDCVPELDRLFLAVRRKGAQGAQVRVYAPAQ